jgi:hypothetical protein
VRPKWRKWTRPSSTIWDCADQIDYGSVTYSSWKAYSFRSSFMYFPCPSGSSQKAVKNYLSLPNDQAGPYKRISTALPI